MPLTIDDMEALREGWDFEAKLATGRHGRGELPRSFWETYAAMANTRGGTIVLGVKQHDDGRLEVRGIADPQSVVADLWNLAHNPQKVSVNLLREDSVTVEQVDGMAIVVVEVPAADRADRPVHLDGDLLGRSFVRAHDGDYRLDRDRARRMLADADRSRPRDAQVLKYHGLDRLDAETMRSYRGLLSARTPDHPALQREGVEFLARLGLWGTDPETGETGLRKAALLLFGEESALRDVYPSFHLDYREIGPGADRWHHRIFPDGTWNANLLQFYWRTIRRLHDDLDLPFALDENLVRVGETPIHQALREALVNALVHTDYEARQAVVVERRADAFTFTNPGSLLIPERRAREGGRSECRNPSLQQAFVLAGLGERAGTGIPRIFDAWRGHHLRAPELVEDTEVGTTTLRLSRVGLFPQKVLDGLDARFPGFYLWPHAERLAVVTAELEGQVTNQRMQQICDMHRADLTQLLRSLVDRGALVQHGDRRGAWYTVAGDTAADGAPRRGASSLRSSPQSRPSSSQSGPSSPQSSAQSGPNLPQSGPNLPQSGPNLPQSGPNLPQSGPNLPQSGPSLPQSGLIEAPRVHRVAASRYARAEVLEEAIEHVCLDEFVHARQIAQALGRTRKTLSKHLTRLVREGRLEQEHPNSPRHPNQRYRTVVEEKHA